MINRFVKRPLAKEGKRHKQFLLWATFAGRNSLYCSLQGVHFTQWFDSSIALHCRYYPGTSDSMPFTAWIYASSEEQLAPAAADLRPRV